MTDATLHRLAQHPDTYGTGQHLRARLRAGLVGEPVLRLAAYLGYEGARGALDWWPVKFTGPNHAPGDPFQSVGDWATGLAALVDAVQWPERMVICPGEIPILSSGTKTRWHLTCCQGTGRPYIPTVRWVLVAAALRVTKAAAPYIKPARKAIRVGRACDATQAWLDCPCERHAQELTLGAGGGFVHWWGMISWIAHGPGSQPPAGKWFARALTSASTLLTPEQVRALVAEAIMDEPVRLRELLCG